MAKRRVVKAFTMANARKVVRHLNEGRACSQGDMKSCIRLLSMGLQTATANNRVLKNAVNRAESLVERLLPR